MPPSQTTPEIQSLIADARPELPAHHKIDHHGIADPLGLVCSPFRVVRNTRSPDRKHYGLLIEIVTPDRHINSVILPREKLDSRPSDAVGLLADNGLQTYEPYQRVVKIIKKWKVSETITALDRSGWTSDGLCYAFPDGRIVRAAGVPDTLRLANPTTRAMKGTFEGWRDNVSSLCCGNPYMIFATSVAFAAPLFGRFGVAPGLFHFHGKTSRGKSTLLRLATSVWHHYVELPTWRSTSNGLEASAAPAHHGLLVFDELNLTPHEEFGTDIYMLVNGTGKARATKTGELQQRRTWTAGILSSGEKASRHILERMSGEVTGGQSVRFIDIHIPAHGTGAFDDLHGQVSGDAFAKRVRHLIDENSGHAAENFVGGVLRKPAAELRTVFAQYEPVFVSKLKESLSAANEDDDLSDPAVGRVLSVFALVSFAGKLAAGHKIVAWNTSEAETATLLIAKRWLLGRNVPDEDDGEVGTKLRDYLQTHGEHFVDLKADSPLPSGAPGWRDDTYFYLTDEAMAAVFPDTNWRSGIPAVLLRLGVLKRGSDGDSYKAKFTSGHGKRERGYRIIRSILDSE